MLKNVRNIHSSFELLKNTGFIKENVTCPRCDLKKHYCKDHYRYICAGITCKRSSSIKKFMSTYCPTSI